MVWVIGGEMAEVSATGTAVAFEEGSEGVTVVEFDEVNRVGYEEVIGQECSEGRVPGRRVVLPEVLRCARRHGGIGWAIR